MAYVIDASVFMQAKNLHYGFDFCPAFWDWLVRENGEGRVFSIEKVGDEIAAGEDELTTWAEKRGASFFLPPDQDVLGGLRHVATWVTTAGYDQAAVSTFLQVADAYLVAHAFARGWVVVTHEIPAKSSRKVKIPDACVALGVKYMTPFAMLRLERARFALLSKSGTPGKTKAP